MNSHTAQIDDLRLIALPTAVNCADLFVRFTLTEWSLRPLSDDASDVACQLTTMIVEGADSRSPGLFTLRLRLRGGYLTIEVEVDRWMSLVRVPRSVAGRPTDVTPLSSGSTLVRCELPLPGGLTASAVPLPRRERKRSMGGEPEPQEPEETDLDPQLMRRILFGLGRPSDESPQ